VLFIQVSEVCAQFIAQFIQLLGKPRTGVRPRLTPLRGGFNLPRWRRMSAQETRMKLTPEQREQFEREGYLFFPGLFSREETKVLTDAVPELYARRDICNVREKDSDAVRTNFAAHLYSAPFAKLARHPRMIDPVRDLFGEDVYMHQFKINGKMAFEGDVWQWHQDYGTWLNDDLMPTERAMNVAIFLDDVNDFNGPLMFIPGSHKKGAVEAKHDLTTTSYPLWTVDNDLIRQLVQRAGNAALVAELLCDLQALAVELSRFV